MKNVQVIDGAENCTYDVFQATDDEFSLIFPDGTDIEFVEDLIARVGQDYADAILGPLWKRRQDKKLIQGIHGTLFFELESKRKFYPTKRDSEMRNPRPGYT